jgi:putative PIN family toxin of toxin-antitoxin system
MTKKNIKVIFDTNVWISFLIGKRLSVVKNYISNGQISIVVTNQLLKEIEEVTNHERLKKYFPKESVLELMQSVWLALTCFEAESCQCRRTRNAFWF